SNSRPTSLDFEHRALGSEVQLFLFPTTLTVAVTQSLLVFGSLSASSDETQAKFVAVLAPVLKTCTTAMGVSVSPAWTIPYWQNGVSAEMPRSQVSLTSVNPCRTTWTSSSAASGPLFVATIVNVTCWPTCACLRLAVFDTIARSAFGTVCAAAVIGISARRAAPKINNLCIAASL